VIEVEDDGGGIDLEKIKQKALSKGLVQDINSMSDREALDLIFPARFFHCRQDYRCLWPWGRDGCRAQQYCCSVRHGGY
jgi:hypothetical protein